MAEPKVTCCVECCNKPPRSSGQPLCEMHYYRKRRNGHLRLKADYNPPELIRVHTQGYLMEYAPGHPLAEKSGSNRIYQHRRVFFDAHGKGPFKCHWCATRVTWADMHVDHLNAVRHDNRAINLVSSCAACNHKRGHKAMRTTSRNRSQAKIEWNGESLTAGEWAERLGIARASITWRIANGWTVERALTEPRGKFGPKPQRPQDTRTGARFASG